MRRLCLLAPGALAIAAAAFAQTGYERPPDAIARIAEAAPTAGISVAPGAGRAVLTHRDALIPLDELSRPELRVAGLRIDTGANTASRRRVFRRITLKSLPDGAETAVTGLPDPLRGDHLSWSPDGSRFAFTHSTGAALELWVVEGATGAASRLLEGVNGIFRSAPHEWLSDSETLVVRAVAPGRGNAPEMAAVPAGPVIQESSGRAAPARTYQDLLANPHDEALFRHYGATQVVTVDLAGNRAGIGDPGIVAGAVPSPDARHVLITRCSNRSRTSSRIRGFRDASKCATVAARWSTWSPTCR